MALTFNISTPSPYRTAPSSPKLLDNLSGDASPVIAAGATAADAALGESFSSIPFNWEEKPGKPKSFDFAFEFRDDQLKQLSLVTAGDAIKSSPAPLKLPPRMQSGAELTESISPNGINAISKSRRIMRRNVLVPRSCDFDFDPFEIAIENARRNAGSSECETVVTAETKPYRKRRKWRLKNLLSFRSTSDDESKRSNSSFRSGSPEYEVNRIRFEPVEKRMMIPYKQCFLGCIGINRSMQGLVKGMESLSKA